MEYAKDFADAIRILEATSMYSKKDGLGNMQRLLEMHPELRLTGEVVHVAGTNGKGSMCAAMAKIFEEAGYKTGRYISPHLVSYTERMSIDGEDISEEEFTELFNKVKDMCDELVEQGYYHPTFFEILTSISFLYFNAHGCERVVLEVGMGGRLDATNVCSPILSIIMSISLDHMKVLGDTLPAIAGEKAGIIKPGVPVVLSHNEECVKEVVRARAAEMGAKFYDSDNVTTEVIYNDERGLKMDARCGEPAFDYPGTEVSLNGLYQRDNMATALMAANVLGDPRIDEQVIRRALENVYWPGRMEYVPFAGKTMLLDGAHNPDAAKRLMQYLNGMKKPFTLLFSVLAKKDIVAIVDQLWQLETLEGIIVTHINDGTKGAEMDYLADILLGKPEWADRANEDPEFVTITDCVSTGMNEAACCKTDLVVVCGSLYLVGEVKDFLDKCGEEANV